MKRSDNNQEKIRLVGFLIAIYSMITPIENVLLLFGSGTISKFLAYLLFPILLFTIILKKKSFYNTKMSILLFVFMILTIFSVLLSPDIFSSIRGVITLFSLIILTILIVKVDINSKEYNVLMKLNVYAMLFVSINMVMGTSLVDASLGGRVTFSDLIDHNVLATSMTIPFLIIIDGIMKKSIKRKFMYYLFLAIILFSILLTGSRGGLLALIISTCVYLLLASKGSFYSKMRIGAFVFVLSIIFVFGIEYLLPDNLSYRFTLSDVVSSGGTGRTAIWKDYIDIFLNSKFHNQIFGYGYNSHGIIYSNNYGIIRGAHNDFITILIDLGILGITLIIMLFFQLIKSLYKNKSFLGVSIIIALLVAGLGVDIFFRKFYWNAILIAILNTRHMHTSVGFTMKIFNKNSVIGEMSNKVILVKQK